MRKMKSIFLGFAKTCLINSFGMNSLVNAIIKAFVITAILPKIIIILKKLLSPQKFFFLMCLPKVSKISNHIPISRTF